MKKNNYKILIDSVSTDEANNTGIGIVIVNPEGQIINKVSKHLQGYNSIQAKYKALMYSLRVMKKWGVRSFDVFSDSEDFIRQMQGIYRMRDPILKQLKNMINTGFQDVEMDFVLTSPDEISVAADMAQKGLNALKKSGAFESPPLNMKASQEAYQEGLQKPCADIQRSAGGVLYKKDGDKYKICIISKKNNKVWALPKGRVNEGETPEETAVREVSEETGHLGSIQVLLDQINYYFFWKDNNTLYHKFVYFFLMLLVEENIRTRDQEADSIRWVYPGEAHKMLTYINEKEVIQKAVKLLEQM